ncbi:MAG: RsmE family RNA methyltransferase [Candidatus Sumerlaeaceae bacterium]
MSERYYAGRQALAEGQSITLSAEETQHLVKVMRKQPGAQVRLFSSGQDALGVFRNTENKCAVIQIEQVSAGIAGPDVSLHMLIPWIKGGKTEFVIQKLTELGVASIAIFSSRREVVKPSESKLERLQKVAIEACKQCERAEVPELSEYRDLKSALGSFMVTTQQRLLLYERERTVHFSDVIKVALAGADRRELVIASGPEGGFDPEEIEAVSAICMRVGFGPRILRAETAPIAAAAAALALSGNV